MAEFAASVLACHGCGRPLLTPGSNELGLYVPCLHCARLYVLSVHGLERVLVGLESREIRWVFEELLEAYWSARAGDVTAGDVNPPAAKAA